MRIEIRNLKIAASLSEETTAYTADIFVDGVKTFAASNHGHGGCDMYHRYSTAKVTEAEVSAWLAANEPPMGPYEADPAQRAPYDTGTLCDLEMFVQRHVAKVEAAKETARIRKQYERKLATRICALDEQGHFVIFGKASDAPTPANLTHLRAKRPNVTFLSDADEATKERGLLAFCPDLNRPSWTDRDTAEAVYERLRENRLTVADAKWLLADECRVERPCADTLAHLRDIITKGEAAEQAYRDDQMQRAARDAAGAVIGQVS